MTATPAGGDPAGLAAVRACERVRDGAPGAAVVEFGRNGRPATVIATTFAKDLERRLQASEALPETVTVSARGALLFACVQEPVAEVEGSPGGGEAIREVLTLTALLPASLPVFVVAPPNRFRGLLEVAEIRWREVVILACDREPADPGSGTRDPLLELTVGECRPHCDRVETVPSPPPRLQRRRALAGRPALRGRGRRGDPDRSAAGETERPSVRLRDWFGGRGRNRSAAGERGQASPLVLGGVFALVLGAVVLVMLGGAITGKARGQRTADLAALSAVRSMRDDLPRLMAPPTLPNGLPNPYHLPKPVYLARARLAATANATANGASPAAVSVRFPDAGSWAPVRARVTVKTGTRSGSGGGFRRSRPVRAEARLSASALMGAVPRIASGGGYSGPLAERQGRGLRPDVAAAFDAMAAAARRSGVTLAINSAFRSDAEQAALFAANPNPTMVARPGTSLHRCATELDLGPPSAYGWLAANARRFGFTQRYSWEPWHYGFTAGPAPCSAAGNRAGRRGDPRQSLTASLPGFVPARFRRPILRAAMRWNVSPALLAAQLYAESGFNPNVTSSAGAQGIAQFMPATAASYGLRNPFDPEAAILAQAHLMSDLLRQFGSPALALAAYNAGPGAVAPCRCIPPYAETRAYVTRILALLGGAGAIAPMPMEIELIA